MTSKPDDDEERRSRRRARNLRYRAKKKLENLKESEVIESSSSSGDIQAKYREEGLGARESESYSESDPGDEVGGENRPYPEDEERREPRIILWDPGFAAAVQKELSYPVAFPTTCDFLLTTIFTGLNRDLQAWGYLDDPRFVFAERIDEERAVASADPGELKRWMEGKEEWLKEGDSILQRIEGALYSELLLSTVEPAHIRRNTHRVLCSTALSIQYMTVVVEHHLDDIDTRKRNSPV